MAAAAAIATSVNAPVEAMVRMVHSGVLPPYLAALKQQLLDECERQAAAADGTHTELQMYTDGSASLSLRKSTSASVTRKLQEQQQAPWDQEWHGVREWDWDDVRGRTPGGAQDRETSLSLLLALLPSLHPRLTALHIYKSTEAPVAALCAALFSLSRQPPAATTITHLTLECTRLRRQGDAAHGSTETGSARHLSRFLRSAHCTVLSLHLQHFHDASATEVEQGGHGGGGRVTALGHIARALQVNTSVTALRLAWCTLSSSTVREVAAMFSNNRTVQVLALRGVECEAERGPGQSSSRSQWSQHIVPALRGNSALRSVTLHDCRGIRGDEVVRSLRELVRANATIQHLGLEGTPLDEDGKAATTLKELHLGEAMAGSTSHEEVHDQDNTMAAAAACTCSASVEEVPVVEEDRYPVERADTSCELGEASTSAGHHEFQDNTTAAAAAAWSSSTVAVEEMVDEMVRMCLACSSASVEEMVRMAHSGGDLAPSLAAFKQELLDECERQAARGDDHDLSLKLTWRDLLFARSSMSVSLAEEYQQAPWDRTWDDVRQWNWCDVLDVGGAEEKVTSLCLLLALLPSLHPRLTTLHICILSEIQGMEGIGEWMQDLGEWRVLPYLVKAVEVLCASMLSLSGRSANTIAHLELTVGFEDYTGRGSLHLSRLLCSAHCTLLSLQLDGATDGHRNVVDVDRDRLGPGGEERSMTSLCRIVDALRGNTSLTALRISNCMLCTATVREMDFMVKFRNSRFQALNFCHNTFDTEEDVKDVARWLGKTISSAPSLHTLQCWHAPFSATHWSGTILPAMCGNRALRNVSLRENSGIEGDEVFQCLLHLVLTNTRIHHLGLERTPLDEDGRAATILKELQEVHAYW